MAFSESIGFGDSTFMKLESQVKHALNNDCDQKENDEPLESISESPNEKQSSNKFITPCLERTRRRFLTNITQKAHVSANCTQHRKFRRSKSDSKLPKTLPQNGINLANFSHFSKNNITFIKDVKNSDDSVLEKSQIEAFLESEQQKLKESSCIEENVMEKPIFSDFEDFEQQDNEGIKSQDFFVDCSALHDVSTFVCPPQLDKIQHEQLIETELRKSHRFIQESGINLDKKKTSLTDTSADQLNLTPESTQVIKEINESLKVKEEVANKQILKHDLETLKSIKSWNLPSSVLQVYERKGVQEMFDWQVECLSNPKILFEHCNLVYSAPTSAGKTLVSEILLLKTVLERQKKVLMILPFISVVREKMFYLQDLLTSAGHRVEGFFGGYNPPGGFDSIQVAICTIEKANSIVNKLLEQRRLDEIGCVIVDEVHLISDPGRGYILELLLAKILYMSRQQNLQLQVITMSATLANVELLKNWLDAELYITQFRPVALQEMIKIDQTIYDNQLNILRSLKDSLQIPNDSEQVAYLCVETLLENCSVVIFCPSKDWCENLALQLAQALHGLRKQDNEYGERLKTILKSEVINDVKQQLRDIPTGLDSVLEKTITYGCAFHHAGLTTEERDIIEASFKSGALKIIVATSTLSSGVNLPARRVLIRTPMFGGKQMSSLTYRQMIGRAGRTGKDTLGESILLCTENNARIGKDLIMADLKPISSCLELESSTHLKRALLEVVTSGIATTSQEINTFVSCTLLSAQKRLQQQEKDNSHNSLQDHEYFISEALDFLLEYEFIRLQKDEETETEKEVYIATRLGMACLSASMPPTDGLILFAELQKSRRCFVLESELHAVYLVTPYSVCYQLQDLDWLLFLDLWEKLSPAMKKVGELVGVKESFLVKAMRGHTKLDYKLMQIHKRFYTALALQELVNETPINVVAYKYKCTRGLLQSLQQMASTFAGIVTSFCHSLQWDTLALIVSQFKERLFFGIHRDLIDLMRLPDLNHKRARALYKGGVTTLIELAQSDVLQIEKILHDSLSFDSSKQHEHENSEEAKQRNEARNLFITGQTGVTVAEAAKLLIEEARIYLQYDLGVDKINWSQKDGMKQEESFKKNDDLEKCNNLEKSEMVATHEMSFEENVYTKQHFTTKQETQKETAGLKESLNPKEIIQKVLQEKNLQEIEKSKNQNYNKETEDNNDMKNKENQCLKIKQNENLSNVPKTVTNKSEEPLKCLTKKSFQNKQLLSVPNVQQKQNPQSTTAKEKRKSKDLPEEKDVTPPKQIKSITNEPNELDDKPSTSKKAQRLLRARQLSRMKKMEWVKRRQATINNESRSLNKSIKKEGNQETPKIKANKVEALPRRSPRNHLANGKENNPQTIKQKLEEQVTEKMKEIIIENGNNTSFPLNTDLEDVLKHAELQVKQVNEEFVRSTTPSNLNAAQQEEDEIPNSQQKGNEVEEEKPYSSPYNSKLLRSARFTQNTKIKSPKNKLPAKPIPTSASCKEIENDMQPCTNSTIEFSDISLDNSLLRNPLQLNASHILSCSEQENEAASFKCLEIIDICANAKLFKAAFKELMACKRLAMCLGLQQQLAKRKPLIGGNLLINQVAQNEQQQQQQQSNHIEYNYQIDDVTYLDGIAFCFTQNIVFYMNMQENDSCKDLTSEIKSRCLSMLLTSTDHTLLMFEAKEQLKIVKKLFNHVTDIKVKLEDPKVANWLLQPDKIYSLPRLVQQYAPECCGLVNLCGNGRGYNSYGLDATSNILPKVRSSIEACITLHILKGLIENLERIGTGQLYKFFTDLEMPLQVSLCKMELEGFPTNPQTLHKLFQQIVETMKKLEYKIYELHGAHFNLTSSAAVAKVLGLHRKPNGRVSTAKQILEKIDTPISQMIMTYRKLSVTVTKSIQPLLKCITNERIRGQSITFTATGRISMAEPNLQNVTKDFEVNLRKETILISCRQAFQPNDPKRCLLSSDFCQLEMRILTHLCQDVNLVKVMRSEKDIFISIAAEWNKISEKEVTEHLRNATKQICYGIVYGMGVRALADSLKCTEQEAAYLSQQFHAAYPGIRIYMEKVIKFARNNGYVETVTGRRRYLEHINHAEIQLKSQAERQAINTTIQGSAADIAKNAILRMEKNLIKYQEKLNITTDAVKLVLHLHDELIYEIPEDKGKRIAKVLSVTMENCVNLNVPLKVKLKMGKNWGQLKEIKL